MAKLSSAELNKMESSPGERSIHRQSPEIDIARNVYDENFFTATKRDRFPSSNKDDSVKKNYYWRVVHPKLSSCSCSWKGLISFLAGLMPIIRWLPKYNFKEDLFPDLNGGVTVAVMHVPQGIGIFYSDQWIV